MRYDHTNWLIHFVRDRDPHQDFPGDDEDEVNYYAGGELEVDADAFSVLKTIIRLGGLIPGYSFRAGRTTLYGGRPAICATEMPIYGFSKYVRDREKSDKVSAYGIAFLKNEFFAAGGRPVIYGLSINDVQYTINTATKRIFLPEILPFHEQYRYVSYSPSGHKWIDWSHEREWRWINRDKEQNNIWARNGSGNFGPVSSLPLFKDKNDDGFFSSIGIIVWDEKEAKEIQGLLTGFYLAGNNDYDTPLSKSIIANSFIIILNKVIESVETGRILNAQTIEGLTHEQIIEPIIIHGNSKELEIIVIKAIEKAKNAGLMAYKEYKYHHKMHMGACGYANIISYDVAVPIIQQMLKMGIASGPYDGRVVLRIEGEWEPSQSIDYEEYLVEKMCEVLNRELKVSFYTESQLS